ncbi:MAG: hypothetical protein RL508_607 [Actinomycetota bacterium]|jgi:NCS1 family nucleobase:cation symporter-1
MTQPQNNAWQERVLTDQELTQVLANLGSLEAMKVLQRQLELRAINRGNVGREVDESFELSSAIDIIAEPTVEPVVAPVVEPAVEAVPEPVVEPRPESVVEPLPEPVAEPTPEPVAELAPPATAAPATAAPATDIAGALNALFANRQHVEFAPAPALPISNVAPKLEPISPAETQIEAAPIEVATPEEVVESVIVPENDGNPVFAGTNLDAYPPTEPGFLSSRAFAPAPVVSDDGQPVPSFSNPVPEKVEQVEEPAEATSQSQQEAPSEVAPEQPSTLEQPQVVAEPTQPEPAVVFAAEAASLPSAEEAVTAFEENYLTAPQPTLVDDVIFAVGGQIADEALSEELPAPVALAVPGEEVHDVPAEQPASAESAISATDTKKYRSAKSLLATWNGTGMLLVIASIGYVFASRQTSLISAAAGAFAALVMSGFGFGAAALSARRGRQPQAVLSRAVFGVNGASVPLVVVILARLTATASISILAAQAIRWFYPSIPISISIAGNTISVEVLIAAALLLVASLTAGMRKTVRYALVTVFAWASVLGALATVVLGAVLKPATFDLTGTFDFGSALSVASTLVIVLGLIWGTSAADESVDLAPTTMVPKLIAASLLNFTVFGLLALVAGYAFAALAPSGVYNMAVGAAFIFIIAISLANQMRRSTDAFRGFGLQQTKWWLLALVLIVVVAGAATVWALVPDTTVLDRFNGILPVVGVPVLAWLSSLGIDSVLRRSDFHEISLVRNYGFYGKVRVANLVGWILATAIGWGFISSNIPGFGWLGYLAKFLGVSSVASDANMGLWIAIAIGMLTPLLFTVGNIRNQEAEGRALAERHQELIDVLGISE